MKIEATSLFTREHIKRNDSLHLKTFQSEENGILRKMTFPALYTRSLAPDQTLEKPQIISKEESSQKLTSLVDSAFSRLLKDLTRVRERSALINEQF